MIFNLSKKYIWLAIVAIFLFSCQNKKEEKTVPQNDTIQIIEEQEDTVIVDCRYSFDEAISGSRAPQEILDELVLLDVQYLSTDDKIHQGQLLCNKQIANDMLYMFDFMLKERFPVAKVIPVVKYDWDDDASMADNNSYSFCYRNVKISKHSQGLAIDINPFFNPQRWKEPYCQTRKDRPEGAVCNPEVPGTFTPESSVVLEFKRLGYFWGGNFGQKHDDHHFEKGRPWYRPTKKIEEE